MTANMPPWISYLTVYMLLSRGSSDRLQHLILNVLLVEITTIIMEYFASIKTKQHFLTHLGSWWASGSQLNSTIAEITSETFFFFLCILVRLWTFFSMFSMRISICQWPLLYNKNKDYMNWCSILNIKSCQLHVSILYFIHVKHFHSA